MFVKDYLRKQHCRVPPRRKRKTSRPQKARQHWGTRTTTTTKDQDALAKTTRTTDQTKHKHHKHANRPNLTPRLSLLFILLARPQARSSFAWAHTLGPRRAMPSTAITLHRCVVEEGNLQAQESALKPAAYPKGVSALLAVIE